METIDLENLLEELFADPDFDDPDKGLPDEPWFPIIPGCCGYTGYYNYSTTS